MISAVLGSNLIWGGTHIIWSIGLGLVLLLWLCSIVGKMFVRLRRGKRAD